MQWFPFLGRREGARLILDIGSASTGVALVADIDGTQTIVWETRVPVAFAQSATFQRAERDVAATVRDALSLAARTGTQHLPKGTAVTDVHAIFAAPWSHTVVRALSVEQEKTFAIDADFIDAYSEKHSKKIAAKLAEDAGDQLTCIGHDIQDIRVNGYKLHTPDGVETKRFDATLLTSFVVADLYLAVSEEIGRTFAAADINADTAMNATVRALAREPSGRNGTIVLVTGEATECARLESGVAVAASFIPYGTETLTRQIADASGIPNAEARAYLRSTETLPEHDTDDALEVLTAYQQALSGLLEQVVGSTNIPKQLFIRVEPSMASFFTTGAKRAAKNLSGHAHTITPILGASPHDAVLSMIVRGEMVNTT